MRDVLAGAAGGGGDQDGVDTVGFVGEQGAETCADGADGVLGTLGHGGETEVDLGEIGAFGDGAHLALDLAAVDVGMGDGGFVGEDALGDGGGALDAPLQVVVRGIFQADGDVALVDLRDEVHLDARGEVEEAQDSERGGGAEEEPWRAGHPLDGTDVGALHTAIEPVPGAEAPGEGGVDPALAPVHGDHGEDGREREGDEERGEGRHRDDHGEGREELARERGHCGDGQEDDHVGEGRGRDRECNVARGGGDDGADFVLCAAALGELRADVLEHHDGVRHQDAHRDAHGAHGDDIEGVAEEREDARRHQHRHGDGDEGREGGADVGQEEQKHQAREEDALPDRDEAVADRGVDVGAVVAEPDQLHAAGEGAVEFLDHALNLGDNLRAVGVALLRDLHGDAGLAVVEGAGGDALGAEVEGRDVAEVDALALDDAHLDVAEALGLVGLAVKGEGDFAVAGVNLPHRDLDVALAHGLDDVGHGEAAAGELVAVDVHDDLALHAADEVDAGHAGQGGETVA